jgi:hypothetical protein
VNNPKQQPAFTLPAASNESDFLTGQKTNFLPGLEGRSAASSITFEVYPARAQIITSKDILNR